MKPVLKKIALLTFLFVHFVNGGLLGAGIQSQMCFVTNNIHINLGTGDGSCRAAPFRSEAVQWTEGCPDFAPCCSEYGYCHTR